MLLWSFSSIFYWRQSQQRLHQLIASYEEIIVPDTEILATLNCELTARVTTNHEFCSFLDRDRRLEWNYEQLLVVSPRMICSRYMGKDMFPGHMEFMTDRFGYLRARWVVQFKCFGWWSNDVLTLQLTQLNQEGEIMPLPGDHVHWNLNDPPSPVFSHVGFIE